MKLIPYLTVLLVFTASLRAADVVRLVGDPVLKGNVTDYSMSDGSKLTLKRFTGGERERYQVELSDSPTHGQVVLLNVDRNPLISGDRMSSVSIGRIDSAIIKDNIVAILFGSSSGSQSLLRRRLEPASENVLELYGVSPRIESFEDEQIFELIDLFTIRQTVRDLSKQTLRVHHYFIREDGVQWLDGVLHHPWRHPWMSFQRQNDGTMILDDPYPDGKPSIGGIVADDEPMKPLLLYAAKATAPKVAVNPKGGGEAHPQLSAESQSKWPWLMIGIALAVAWALSRKFRR